MTRRIGEAGFTLAELLIVTFILGLVMAAILSVYQVSQQTYTRASSLEGAQLGARTGLDRMATELRLIGSYWTGATNAGTAITAATSTSITFMGDVNGNTVSGGAETTVAAGTTATGTTVQVSGTASGFAVNDYLHIADGVLREVRQITAHAGTTITLGAALTTTYPAGSLVRSVESVTYTFDSPAKTLTRTVGGGAAEIIVDNVTGLTLTYFDANGNDQGGAPNLALIREIQISLTTQGSDGSRRTMSSRVKPRNLS
jgi:prepilin-type N-terminal cleavage/methylation domain-containing protein